MDECLTGLELLQRYLKTTSRIDALSTQDGIIWVKATDRLIGYDDVRTMIRLGWFQNHTEQLSVSTYDSNLNWGYRTTL